MPWRKIKIRKRRESTEGQGLRGTILCVEARKLSDKKPEGDKRPITVYIWGKTDPQRKNRCAKALRLNQTRWVVGAVRRLVYLEQNK